ncbi:lysophospholipid acyltransferase family protein [Allorhizobium undicola]|uniref:lysophospholipid acyltransferase family protein n=1 Tax=Allorhizobium undicola TaxID=78527 RepID=UPI0004810578
MILRIRAFILLGLLVAVTFVMLPAQLLGLAFDWKLRRRLPRYWHKVACLALGVKVRVHGRIEERRPLMLSANHCSWLDIMVLSSVADVAFIAKTEVADWPIFGTLAKLQKSVFVKREEKRSTGKQANDIAERMAAGEIVVLFPEGTTSDGNRLLPTKSSLYGAAAMALPLAPEGSVYIQPVAIAYTGIHGMPMGRFHRPYVSWPGDVQLAPHLADLLGIGAVEVDVCFGEPEEYREGVNRKRLAATVEARIRALLSARLLGRDLS